MDSRPREPAPEGGRSTPPRSSDASALIGRDEELAWAASRVRPGGGVVIAGEAGVGKTRLGGAIAARARAEGSEVIRVVGTSSLRTVALGALAWLLPSTNPATDPHPSSNGPSESTTDRLAAACGALADRAADAELVLVLDDAHWLDDPTIAVARQLLMAGGAAVVVTVRSGEPVSELLTSLWKDELCERLDLQPLSSAQVADLASARLGGPLAPETVDHLTQVTAGNPLYLRELLSGLVHAGALTDHDGVWAWGGELVVGERLAELLTHRTHRLSPEAQALAVTVALGEPLPEAVVARLAPPATVQEAHRHGVLVTDGPERRTVRLKHPLLGSVLLADAGDTTEHVRRLVAAARQTPDASDADLVRLARWGLDARQPDAGDLAAAARLIAVVDHQGATEFAAAAVETDDTLANRLLYVETLVSALRFDVALEQLDVIDRKLAARDDPKPVGDLDSERARATADLWRISCLGWGVGDLVAVRGVVDRFPEDHPSRPMLEAHWSAVLASFGSTEGAARAFELLDHPDPAVSFRALAAADLADCLAGRCETCITRAEGLLMRAVEHGEVHRKARWIMAPLLRAFLLAGRLDDFGHYLDLAAGQVSPRALPAAYVALPQGRYALSQGRARAALLPLEHAVQQARQGELEPWWYRFATAMLAEAYALTGRVAEAQVMAKESNEIASSLRVVGPRPEDLDSRRALVWVEVAAHGAAAGRAAAEAETQRCVDVDAPMFELLARHDAVRLGSPADGHVARFAELAESIEGGWPEPILAQARGIAQRDPALLEHAAERFAAMGAWMLGAEAAARAAGVHEASGDAASHRRLEARAGALAAACEGTAIPLSDAAPSPMGLTNRERDVAALAASGSSSKDIAEALFVSVRTVDNHLGRVYAKLGVRSRTELAERLRELS